MSDKISIQAEKRDESLNPRQLRDTGKLPATIYGKGIESISAQLPLKEFVHIYKSNKDSVYELSGLDKKYSVIVKNLQVEASTKSPMNVELQLA